MISCNLGAWSPILSPSAERHYRNVDLQIIKEPPLSVAIDENPFDTRSLKSQ